MDKDTQEELDRLEREIWREDKDLSDILADDVLKDLDEILEKEAAEKAAQKPPVQEFVDDEEDEDDEDDEEDEPGESKDGLTIGLLITASALCVAIIGVMIYWLENFL
jgi:hypothetical protein